jgi:HAD superfamily hydrolase (TIGR01549 family)
MKNIVDSKTPHQDLKAIFFDAGGTLIHLDSAYVCHFVKKELNIELAASRFRRAQFVAMSRVAELVAASAGSTEKLKRDFYSTLLPEVGVENADLSSAVECVLKLAEGEMLWRATDETTAPTLAALKDRGLLLGVISNSDGRIESAFQQAGLGSYFDFFIDSFHAGVEKPDPRIFQLAVERAGVSPDQAAHVGDLYWVDVVGARDAGLLPILFDPYDLNREADCWRIHTIAELLNSAR